MNYARALMLLCFLWLTGWQGHAQDIHFSQFYASPLLVNPAKAGFISADYRFTGIYRSQWSSITVPYNTFAASADGSIIAGKKKHNFAGAGLTLFNDKAGDSHFTTTLVGLSFAYHKAIDKFQNQFLSFGIAGQYVASNLSYNNLRWDEQYEGGTLTETFATASSSYTDVSAGIEYTWLYSKNQNVNAGLAVYHLNQPVQTFMGDNNSRVFQKYVFNAGVSFSMFNRFTGYPRIYFSKQGPYNEAVFGFLARYSLGNVTAKNDYGIYLGSFMRWNDAFIFSTRFDINRVALGFSYDINFSRLNEVSHGRGGPELSVQYTGNIPNLHHKKVYCPRF